MPSKYKSQEEKITTFIKNVVIPKIIERGEIVDYNKIIDNVSLELCVTREKVEKVIRRFIDTNQFTEIHHLKAPDKKVDSYLDKLENMDKEAREVLEEMEIEVKKKK